jgi:hypothetical protein
VDGETSAKGTATERSTDEAAPAGPLTDADAASTDPPAAPPDDARRLAVLAAVERGEIDVEEALRRLDAADPGTDP